MPAEDPWLPLIDPPDELPLWPDEPPDIPLPLEPLVPSLPDMPLPEPLDMPECSRSSIGSTMPFTCTRCPTYFFRSFALRPATSWKSMGLSFRLIEIPICPSDPLLLDEEPLVPDGRLMLLEPSSCVALRNTYVSGLEPCSRQPVNVTSRDIFECDRDSLWPDVDWPLPYPCAPAIAAQLKARAAHKTVNVPFMEQCPPV